VDMAAVTQGTERGSSHFFNVRLPDLQLSSGNLLDMCPLASYSARAGGSSTGRRCTVRR
jgi:hypothetical protein